MVDAPELDPRKAGPADACLPADHRPGPSPDTSRLLGGPGAFRPDPGQQRQRHPLGDPGTTPGTDRGRHDVFITHRPAVLPSGAAGSDATGGQGGRDPSGIVSCAAAGSAGLPYKRRKGGWNRLPGVQDLRWGVASRGGRAVRHCRRRVPRNARRRRAALVSTDHSSGQTLDQSQQPDEALHTAASNRSRRSLSSSVTGVTITGGEPCR